MEKMTSLKSQLERMDTIKSKVVFFIQQFRGQVITSLCFCYRYIAFFNVNALLYAVFRVLLLCWLEFFILFFRLGTCLVVLEIKVQHKYNKDPLLRVRKCDLAGGMIFFLHILLLLGNCGLDLTLVKFVIDMKGNV